MWGRMPHSTIASSDEESEGMSDVDEEKDKPSLESSSSSSHQQTHSPPSKRQRCSNDDAVEPSNDAAKVTASTVEPTEGADEPDDAVEQSEHVPRQGTSISSSQVSTPYTIGICDSTKYCPSAWRSCQCNSCDNCAERMWNHRFSALCCLDSICTNRSCPKCTSAITSANFSSGMWITPSVLRHKAKDDPYQLSQTNLTALCSSDTPPKPDTSISKAYGYSISNIEGGDQGIPPVRSYPLHRCVGDDLQVGIHRRWSISMASVQHGVDMLEKSSIPEADSDADAKAALDALLQSFPPLHNDYPDRNLFRLSPEDEYWLVRRNSARQYLLTLEQANLLTIQCNPVTRIPLVLWQSLSHQADLSASIIRRIQSRTAYEANNYHRI
jgi:hypothetical protein